VKNAFSPYWEAFLEAEYYYSDNLMFKLSAGRQTSVVYNIVDPGTSDIIRTFTIPVEVKYDFMKKYSVQLNTEFQKVFNSIRVKQKFYNAYLSAAVSRSPNLVLAYNMELSSDEEDPTGKKVWYQGEVTYKFSSANSITVSYGSERGGLKCSSGICRYVSPFHGFRLTVINNFN
jgi:hypothetical protein